MVSNKCFVKQGDHEKMDMITRDEFAVGGGGEGLDVKFNTYRGALLFHSFLQTGKVVEELLKFKYKY